MSIDPTVPSSSTAARRPKWWYSADERRGFAWASVVGYDYRAAGMGGAIQSTLYLYLTAALLHLHGAEAEAVMKELKAR